MKKYVAVIEMTSFYGLEQHIVQGDTAGEVLTNFEEIQHLGCLVRMGRQAEGAKGQKQLDILEAILNKRAIGTLTIEDLTALDIHLSLGKICFLEAFCGEGAMEALQAKYPEAK